MSTWEIGKIGEQIVEDFLLTLNWQVYRSPKDKAHAIDWVLVTPDMKSMAIAEAKTKPRRLYYPDTGFDYKHFLRYRHLFQKYKMDTFVVWVDPGMRKIYGNRLSELTKQITVNGMIYPYYDEFNRGIIYFPLVSMAQIGTISEEHAIEINELSNKTYKYNPKLDFEFIVQPALLQAPYQPRQRRRPTRRNFEDPKFLQKVILVKICQCTQSNLNPNLHDDYCEYRKLLTMNKVNLEQSLAKL